MESNLGQVLLVKDIRSGTNNYGDAHSSEPSYLTEINSKLYSVADDGEIGEELWVSEGT